MYRLLIFGGTAEGRELAEFCVDKNIRADISVATVKGAELLPKGINILEGRLDSGQIEELLRKNGYTSVIDATHPYAREITINAKTACEGIGIRYKRVLRESLPVCGKAFESGEQMADTLNHPEYKNKVILSTLGSKSLSVLTHIDSYSQRVWLRLLPAEDIEEKCRSLGFDTKKLILEKGPFSTEENISHIKQSGAQILLTKESGERGGYPQKAAAAEKCGTMLMTLTRPQESGMSLSEAKEFIMDIRENDR